jgi:hypothetical protein
MSNAELQHLACFAGATIALGEYQACIFACESVASITTSLADPKHLLALLPQPLHLVITECILLGL